MNLPARRIPVPEGEGERLFAVMNEMFRALEPGDYCGPIVGYTADKPSVFYKLPGVADPNVEGSDLWGFGHVTSPPHTFRECTDGSLEIRESIGHHHHKFYWHGYLDESNIWRVLELISK